MLKHLEHRTHPRVRIQIIKYSIKGMLHFPRHIAVLTFGLVCWYAQLSLSADKKSCANMEASQPSHHAVTTTTTPPPISLPPSPPSYSHPPAYSSRACQTAHRFFFSLVNPNAPERRVLFAPGSWLCRKLICYDGLTFVNLCVLVLAGSALTNSFDLIVYA